MKSFLLILSLVSFSAQAVELSINDLRAIDSTVDQQLADAGYDEDPNELSLEITEETSPSEDKKGFTFDVRTTAPGKNLWVAGAVLSSVYIQGAQLSYHRYNPRKDKINYHIDLSAGGTKEFQNVSLTFDPHIGRWGLFAGVGGSMIRVKSELLPTSPAIQVYGVGAEIGWQKEWGPKKRVITNVRYGATFMYHNLTYYMMREARLTVGVLLFRK